MNFYGLSLGKGPAVYYRGLLYFFGVVPILLLMGLGPNDQEKRLNQSEVSDLLNKVEKEKERLEKKGIPTTPPPPETLRNFLLGQYKEKIQSEANRLQESPYLAGDRPKLSATEKTKGVTSSGRIYLFISSSIPEVTLRHYARDLSTLPNASMIMIGFVGGMQKMAPTAQFISNVLIKDPTCHSDSCLGYDTEVLVDPLLFRKYGITRVPALVYIPEFSEIKIGEGSEGLIPETPKHYAVYGDASLSYLLDMIHRKSKDPDVAHMRDHLQKIQPVKK